MPKKNKFADGKAAPDAPLSRKAKRMEKKGKRKRQLEGEEDSDGEVPPMPEMSTSGAWDFTAAAVKSGGGGKKAKKASQAGEGTIKLCPRGHGLVVSGTPHDEYMCDACAVCNGEFLPAGSTLFGCRLCDWDSCERCTHPATKEKLLAKLKEEEARAAKKAQARSDEMGPEARVGEWKHLRATDKYENEYLLLHHTKTGFQAEMHHYSDGQFTFQNGIDCMVRCVSSPGDIIPFQFTQTSHLSKLAKGGGKSMPTDKPIEFGNYIVTSLDDGGVIASMKFKFTKTTKHKEGDGMFEKVFTGEGMEMHMTRQGDIVYLPEESFGDRGVILQAWKDPVVTDRKTASDSLVDEEDRLASD